VSSVSLPPVGGPGGRPSGGPGAGGSFAGHLSGHRYVIAHRHSKLAQQVGRICFDVDDEKVVHFHDWSVPPEEEVLAAKLIMEHSEPWLRNEATVFGPGRTDLYKNPFGDIGDGVESASFAQGIGEGLAQVGGPLRALCHPRQDLGECHQGLDAAIPGLLFDRAHRVIRTALELPDEAKAPGTHGDPPDAPR